MTTAAPITTPPPKGAFRAQVFLGSPGGDDENTSTTSVDQIIKVLKQEFTVLLVESPTGRQLYNAVYAIRYKPDPYGKGVYEIVYDDLTLLHDNFHESLIRTWLNKKIFNNENFLFVVYDIPLHGSVRFYKAQITKSSGAPVSAVQSQFTMQSAQADVSDTTTPTTEGNSVTTPLPPSTTVSTPSTAPPTPPASGVLSISSPIPSTSSSPSTHAASPPSTTSKGQQNFLQRHSDYICMCQGRKYPHFHTLRKSYCYCPGQKPKYLKQRIPVKLLHVKNAFQDSMNLSQEDIIRGIEENQQNIKPNKMQMMQPKKKRGCPPGRHYNPSTGLCEKTFQFKKPCPAGSFSAPDGCRKVKFAR